MRDTNLSLLSNSCSFLSHPIDFAAETHGSVAEVVAQELIGGVGAETEWTGSRFVLMAEIDPQVSEEPVCSAWQRAVQGALGVFLLVSVGLLARYYPATKPNDLQMEVQKLSREVQQLRQEQTVIAARSPVQEDDDRIRGVTECLEVEAACSGHCHQAPHLRYSAQPRPYLYRDEVRMDQEALSLAR